MKTHKFRIYPNRETEEKLFLWLDGCRELYNAAPQERSEAWTRQRKNITYQMQQNDLPWIKGIREDIEEIYSQVLQAVLKRLDRAFDNFFRRCEAGENPGYPRFKGANRFNSILYPQSLGFKLKKGILSLSKLGDIKVSVNRKIKGDLQTCVLKYTAGKWFACLSFLEKADVKLKSEKKQIRNDVISLKLEKKEYGEKVREENSRLKERYDLLKQAQFLVLLEKVKSGEAKSVGIDVGLKVFAMLSDYTVIENPHFYKKLEKRLRIKQRSVARKKHGSKSRKKAVLELQRVHEKIRNSRMNFIHQVTKRIVENNDLIAIEDLKINRMVRNRKYSKGISDVSWGMFFNCLNYKASSAGKFVLKTSAVNTSQDCLCGNKVPKESGDRWHDCEKCGLSIDRDLLAALNVEMRAFNTLNSIEVKTDKSKKPKLTSRIKQINKTSGLGTNPKALTWLPESERSFYINPVSASGVPESPIL